MLFLVWLLTVNIRFADNRINQTILATFLMKRGIKYDVATNGEEAVEKWKAGNFHLVLVGFFVCVHFFVRES
jgi:DNA-binding NtrC family response regulator